MEATSLSILVISCSLNTSSRSHRLARAAEIALDGMDVSAGLIDLREWDLPFCDGRESYQHPSVAPLTDRITRASALLVASPVYNYDLNAAVKNLVEMTGAAWEDKPVGFLCTAGGRSSYMSPIGLANSLMFDFRSLIVPRFVYALKDDFDANGEPSDGLRTRVGELARAVVDLARALAWIRDGERQV
jgi:NAD(P)H-dependent FMN reductase